MSVSGADKRGLVGPLVVILGVAAACRLIVALWLPGTPIVSDGERFLSIADHVRCEGEWPRSAVRSAPLHPLVLAALHSITGPSIRAARLLTAVFGTLTCWLLFRLGRLLFDRTTGLWAAAILALYPLHVFTSALFEYPTTLFVLCLSATLVLILWCANRPEARWQWLAGGAALGVTSLAVPTVLTAAPLMAIWVFLRCGPGFARRALRVAFLTIGCCCIVFAWSGYWFFLTGDVRLMPGAGSESLFYGNCPLAWEYGKADIADVYDEKGAPPERQAAYEHFTETERQARAFPPGPERDRVYSDAVKRFYSEHTGEAVALLARKAALYWLPYAKTIKLAAGSRKVAIMQVLTFTPIALLAFCGALVHRSRWRDLTLLYLVILSQWLTYTIYLVSTRYRSQIDPLLIVLAAGVFGHWAGGSSRLSWLAKGIDRVVFRWERRSHLLAAAALSVLLVISGMITWRAARKYDAVPTWEVDGETAPLTEANALQRVRQVIRPGPAGAWDERIREIGNAVFDSQRQEWLLFYSGLGEPFDPARVHVGLATSGDGSEFSKVGRVLDSPAEDPYVVLSDGTFYLFYEDKSEVPFRKIDLARSRDGRRWEVVRRGVIVPQGGSWQDQDVSSPVVVRTTDGWAMLYEGRGGTSEGRIGLATADDLLGLWHAADEFVLGGGGSWDHNVVPDDVVRQGDRYVLVYHGQPPRSVIAERVAGRRRSWQSGLAVSSDLRAWTSVGPGPVSSLPTLMFLSSPQEVSFLGEVPFDWGNKAQTGICVLRPVTLRNTTPHRH